MPWEVVSRSLEFSVQVISILLIYDLRNLWRKCVQQKLIHRLPRLGIEMTSTLNPEDYASDYGVTLPKYASITSGLSIT